MKTRFSFLLAALGSLVGVAQLSAQGTTFTYQGRLTFNGLPVNGSYDLRFIPFNASDGGNQTGPILTNGATAITEGLFTARLDFGDGSFLNTSAWLEIGVRTNGGSGFNILSPRQPITAAPYALTALNVLGLDGHSLHAASGGPTNAVFVDAAGNVGIGTTSPASRLHVASGAGENLPPRLQSLSVNNFSAGLDFYHGANGMGYVGVPDLGAPFAPGEMLVFGAPGTSVTLWPGGARSLTANTAGQVGIGTAAPKARLDVRGDVRLGPNGQFQAASGEETLRIVRGAFNADGTILTGSGFSVSRVTNSRYLIQFNTPFADAPTVTATSGVAEFVYAVLIQIGDITTETCEVSAAPPERGAYVNRPVHFIAVGPR